MNLYLTIQSKFISLAASHPRLFIPIFRLLFPSSSQRLTVSKDTQIVIEGFPRSANTFAAVAFQMAQPRQLKMAHHIHDAAQVIEGVRLSIPVMVLLRNPIHAVRSLVVRNPEIDPTQAFQNYISFYRAVEDVAQNTVVAHFDIVTTNFDIVIENINRKFNTNFSLFGHTDSNVKKVYKLIEEVNIIRDGGKETDVARPSQERNEIYKKTSMEVSSQLVSQAQEIYNVINKFSSNT